MAYFILDLFGFAFGGEDGSMEWLRMLLVLAGSLP